jgi:hypothetical protein
MLAGHASPGDAAAVAPSLLREAIERSLLPVFAVLLVLAFGNLFATVRFPHKARPADPEVEVASALSGTLDA